jgi:hypothetical protein
MKQKTAFFSSLFFFLSLEKKIRGKKKILLIKKVLKKTKKKTKATVLDLFFSFSKLNKKEYYFSLKISSLVH